MRKRVAIVLLGMIFACGAIFVVQANEKSIVDDAKELFKEVQLFADAITLINTDYIEPVKIKDLVYGAIKGMMAALDDYSQFLDPESFKEIQEETKGQFGGIGIEIGVKDKLLVVIAPMEDTPAFLAGIKAQDKIVKIDGVITRDMTLDEAVKKLRGEPGAKVNLTIIREGVDDPIEFTITRAIIKLKSIKNVEMIEPDIGYIKIVEFQEQTAKDIRKEVKALKEKGANSLILDLRNNPGGLLDAATEAAEIFLKQGDLIVYTEGRDPKKRLEFRAKKNSEFDGMNNIAVLVDKGSASAAEIFAGALKDNKRAIVVGVPTFGKGSVQTVIPLQDNSALRLTTAAYFTPSGKNLRNKGIEPDIYVEREKDKVVSEALKEKGEKEKGDDIFEKLEVSGEDAKKQPKDEKEKREDKGEKTEVKEPKKYDNQVQTAIDILKGARLFDEVRV